MFFDRLSRLLNGVFRPKPRYITVTPVAASGPVQALPPSRLPRHVAIIMDGNGRWAVSRNMPRSAGHAAGTEALRDIIRASDDWGIEALSLYAFSTENWSRSKEEVSALMGLLLKYFNSEIDELDAKHVKITILGDVDGMPEPQRAALISAMNRTKDNTGLKLNIALNYGGRAELVRAARSLARQAVEGLIEPEDIDEAMFADELYTVGLPDVDLLIRTSGEMRTSNFLPWQLTYAEMVFDSCYWPDFDRAHYLKCLRVYAERDRRFGGVSEAVTAHAGSAAPDAGEAEVAGVSQSGAAGKVADESAAIEAEAPEAGDESPDAEPAEIEVEPVITDAEASVVEVEPAINDAEAAVVDPDASAIEAEPAMAPLSASPSDAQDRVDETHAPKACK